jgi:ketosteroid isomerase-like protein
MSLPAARAASPSPVDLLIRGVAVLLVGRCLLSMAYHAFVRQQARLVFERLSTGDYEALVASEDPNLSFTHPGQHPLGSTLHSTGAARLWYQRLFRFFPGMEFDIKELVVKGWPWNTVVAAQWESHATAGDGHPYDNQGVHILQVKWGHAIGVRVYTDTQKTAAACQRMAQHGLSEAAAPPIRD